MDRDAIRTFEDLECWKACRELRIFVAKTLFKSLPKDEHYRLGDQILRAARSTPANIEFCPNARESCWKTVDHMITANDEEMLSNDLLAQGREIASKAAALLNGYISYLRKAAATKSPLEGGSSQ
jgi:four helix bundle protein